LTTRLTCLPLVLLALACQKQPAQAVVQGAAPVAPAPAGPAAAPPAGQAAAAAPAEVKPVPAQIPEVVARVNGEAIHRDDFMRAIQTVEARAGGPVPADRRNDIYRGILDQLVAYRLLIQETKARNTVVTDAEVTARFETVRKQFPSEEAFKQAMAERKVTEQTLREDTRLDLLISKMLEAEIAPKLTVDAKKVSDFYAQNPDRFNQPESVHASHILLRFPDGADAAAKKTIRGEADGLMAKIKAGADFAALAKEHSQDGSAAQGGDLGFFTRGQMVPSFETAAFALPPGGVSEVVESEFGYHIIKVQEKRPARTVPLVEVSEQIEGYLKDQERQQRTEGFVESLKAKSKVDILM
jgi:peptidyl-prolyl cis-trans isomerase C